MDIREMLTDKKFIIPAVAIVGIGVFVANRNAQNGGSRISASNESLENLSQPMFGNDTLFIPTTQYDVEIVEGNKTVDNRSPVTNNVDNSVDNSTGKTEIIPKDPVSPPTGTITPPIVTKPTTPPKVATTPPKATTRSYTVKKGDTLWSLSGGTNAKLKNVLKLNPSIKDPNVIKVGQVIKLPV